MSVGVASRVAVVAWLNYEPPNMDINPGAALGDGKAYDGAARLAPFLEGINTSRPDDPHLTALGHSYGSLTTGIALRDHSTGVDEMAVFGSPGLEVDDAAQLHVPQGHAYNMEADCDWFVSDVGPVLAHGPDVAEVPGIRQLSTDAYTTPDGRHFEGSHGHSEYNRAGDKDTTSEWNLANIIAGTGVVH